MGRARCRPNHIRAEPLDALVWNEIRSHLLQPALLVKAQSVLGHSASLDQTLLSTQINHIRQRLTQVKAERRRLLDAFQGGFLERKEFEDRSIHVGSRLSQLQADLESLEQESRRASAGEKLTTRLREFTSAVTHKLDTMTFHEKQTLVRTVIEEVVIHDNVVKLYFKIPLPKPEPDSPPGAKPHPRPSLSSELHLRSRPDQGVQVRMQRERAAPGVQSQQERAAPARIPGVGEQLGEYRAHRAKQDPGQRGAVVAPQAIEFVRNGEDQMMVRAAQEPRALLLQPALDLDRLALRAESLVTRVIPGRLDVPLGTAAHVATERRGAAAAQPVRCAVYVERQPV